MEAVAVGATVYFGSAESDRQIIAIAKAFEEAHNLGMATILQCYSRNDGLIKDNVYYNTAAYITC
jgi:class I fructose-bisphosphate aldolase